MMLVPDMSGEAFSGMYGAILGGIIGSIVAGFISYALQVNALNKAEKSELKISKNKEKAVFLVVMVKLKNISSACVNLKYLYEICRARAVEGDPLWRSFGLTVNVPDKVLFTSEEIALLYQLKYENIHDVEALSIDFNSIVESIVIYNKRYIEVLNFIEMINFNPVHDQSILNARSVTLSSNSDELDSIVENIENKLDFIKVRSAEIFTMYYTWLNKKYDTDYKFAMLAPVDLVVGAGDATGLAPPTTPLPA